MAGGGGGGGDGWGGGAEVVVEACGGTEVEEEGEESDVDVYPLDAGEMAEAGEVVVTDEGMVPGPSAREFSFVKSSKRSSL